MQFGIVDHMDKGTTSIATCYADRLNLIQLYESLGFRAYHMAEHHGTPLSISPSPNLFLAAAAVKTTRIRLGTLVNVLPLYHPVRLIEEVRMLDHMTGGRLELGGGKVRRRWSWGSTASIRTAPANNFRRCSRSWSRV